MAQAGKNPAGKPGAAAPAHVTVSDKLAAQRAPAAGAAASAGAKAFTKGSDVAFKGPAHQPLVPHELAHVMQQKHGVPKP